MKPLRVGYFCIIPTLWLKKPVITGYFASTIFLKVLAVVLGLAFLLFGYFIYFKKKYNLINGFEADFKAGRKKEEYAKKVGMIEFVVGIVLLITGVALILFA